MISSLKSFSWWNNGNYIRWVCDPDTSSYLVGSRNILDLLADSSHPRLLLVLISGRKVVFSVVVDHNLEVVRLVAFVGVFLSWNFGNLSDINQALQSRGIKVQRLPYERMEKVTEYIQELQHSTTTCCLSLPRSAFANWRVCVLYHLSCSTRCCQLWYPKVVRSSKQPLTHSEFDCLVDGICNGVKPTTHFNFIGSRQDEFLSTTQQGEL